MWNPKNIEIENLFAHKNSKYEFKNDSCVVIFGKNNCDKGLENNGAGKTTLFEAICISLTGDSLRNIKKDNFINRNSKSCKIVFELENKVLKMDLKIIRQFSRSGSSKVEIWENGELNNQITSVNEANKRIAELIGISREDLLRYYIISQDSQYTFFTASDADKKEIMNRITSADMIQPILDDISDKIKTMSGKLDKIDSQIWMKMAMSDALVKQIDDIKSNDSVKSNIELIESKISGCEDKIKNLKDEIESYNSELADHESKLSKITDVDWDDLISKKGELRKRMDSLDGELQENIRTQKKLKAELSDSIECPNCGHVFIQESELGISVEDAKKLLKDVEKEIVSCRKKFDEAKSEFDNVLNEIEKANERQNLINSHERNINNLRHKIKFHESDIESNKERIKTLKNDLAELKNGGKYENLLKSIEEKLEVLKGEIEALKNEKSPIECELEKVRFWNIKMGRLGFTTYLANKSIKVIEGITNNFLRKFGVDISVQINGFTILKSGEVREKIDVFVTHDGVTMESFMAKSGGERGRVTLAGVLGIQHLINLSLNGKGLNLLCFDECFHGMDSRGQENIIKIFEKLGITTMVITQNVSEGFNNENTLYVVKDNDVSRYV